MDEVTAHRTCAISPWLKFLNTVKHLKIGWKHETVDKMSMDGVQNSFWQILKSMRWGNKLTEVHLIYMMSLIPSASLKTIEFVPWRGCSISQLLWCQHCLFYDKKTPVWRQWWVEEGGTDGARDSQCPVPHSQGKPGLRKEPNLGWLTQLAVGSGCFGVPRTLLLGRALRAIARPGSSRSSPWLVQAEEEQSPVCCCHSRGRDLWKPLKGHHSRQSPNSRTTDSTRALTRQAVKPG